MLHAFVMIHAQPLRVATLAEELAGIEGVAEVYSVTGPADIVAVVRVQEQEQLADVVTRHIACLDGIEATETMLAFQAFSKHDLDAMWSIGLE